MARMPIGGSHRHRGAAGQRRSRSGRRYAEHARGLSPTRGSAAGVCEPRPGQELCRFVGVGNVACAVVTDAATRRLVSHNGIVGHSVRKIQEFAAPWPRGALLVMHSDGLAIALGPAQLSRLDRPPSSRDRSGAVPRLLPPPRRYHRGRGETAEHAALTPLLTLALRNEQDVVAVRQRARQIAAGLGFDGQDQVRVATAVSEIGRNAYTFAGGGTVEFQVDMKPPAPALVVKVSDGGPGIADLAAVLGRTLPIADRDGPGHPGRPPPDGPVRHRLAPGKGHDGMAKSGFRARPTVDDCRTLAGLDGDQLDGATRWHAYQEVQQQNRELLYRGGGVGQPSRANWCSLNRELEDTNRGVVALYAELDEKADSLRRADESQDAVPVEHEPRVSHAAQFDSGLTRPAAGSSGRRLNATSRKSRSGYIRRAARRSAAAWSNDLLDLAKVEAGKRGSAGGAVSASTTSFAPCAACCVPCS